MFRINIINQNSVITNSAEFATFGLCQEWYDSQKDNFLVSIPNHTFEIKDISDEIIERNRDLESAEAIELGDKIIQIIRKINRRKIRSGEWDNAKFNQLVSNPVIAQIERALWNGSLNSADALFNNASAFYSEQEIQTIRDMIKDHENKWRLLV